MGPSGDDDGQSRELTPPADAKRFAAKLVERLSAALPDSIPFEFRCLEFALEFISSCQARRPKIISASAVTTANKW